MFILKMGLNWVEVLYVTTKQFTLVSKVQRPDIFGTFLIGRLERDRAHSNMLLFQIPQSRRMQSTANLSCSFKRVNPSPEPAKVHSTYFKVYIIYIYNDPCFFFVLFTLTLLSGTYLPIDSIIVFLTQQ